MVELPLEILCSIITIVASDDPPLRMPKLRALALTCKNLLPFCRQHIFADIQLWGTVHWSSEDAIDPSAQAFAQLITNEPQIASYVRTLEIRVGFWVCISNDLFWRGLTNINHLEALVFDAKKLPYEKIFENPTASSSVTHLLGLPSLASLTFKGIRDLPLSAFSLCPTVRRLTFRGTVTLDEDADTATVIPDRQSPIALQELSLCIPLNCYSDLKHLFSAKLPNSRPVIDISGLKTLTITNCVVANDAVRYLVDLGANSVEEFRVSYHGRPTGLSDGLKPLAPSLKRIFFSTAVSYLYELLPELSAISLSGQQKNFVEMIGIHLQFTFPESVDRRVCSEWDSLADLLVDKHAWPALRDVDISIECRDISDREWVAMGQVAKQLAPLASAGLLRCSLRRWVGKGMTETRRMDYSTDLPTK